MIERYPSILPLSRKNAGAVLQAMDNGNCSVGLLTEDEWRRACMGGYSAADDHPAYASHPAGFHRYHCDTKIALPGSIYFLENA